MNEHERHIFNLGFEAGWEARGKYDEMTQRLAVEVRQVADRLLAAHKHLEPILRDEK